MIHFFFSDYFPLFDHLFTSKGYKNKQDYFNPFILNTPWLCMSCSISSPAYEMTSPNPTDATGDAHVGTGAQCGQMSP